MQLLYSLTLIAFLSFSAGNPRSMSRIAKEWSQMQKNPPPGIQVSPVSENNLMEWTAIVDGPEGSPYEGGKFHLHLTLTAQYPMAPPKVKMLTKIVHPNINGGNICLDTLSSKWSASLTIAKVLLSIQSLLNELHYHGTPTAQYIARAKESTRLYAMENQVRN